MQSAVDNILNGNFNTGRHSLNFSTPVIELTVNEGDLYEGSFVIYGPADAFTEGKVSSTGLKMRCPVENFSGTESEIPYIFDGTMMSEGDTYKGEFRIISNQGEYLVPYDIRIGGENIDTSMGDIKNLFHFTNLARSNWNEAVSLFCSDDFRSVLTGSDRMHLGAYNALKNAPDHHQALEEFLLKIKKKQKVEFIVDETEVRIDSLLGSMEKNLMIHRNGWGYSTLFISTDSTFIHLFKEKVEDGDFLGNSARVSYRIDPLQLHEGKNFGRIILKNAYNRIEVEVCVNNHSVNRKIADLSRMVKHRTLDLMLYYEAFRCRKISASTWMQETGAIVESLRENDRDNIYYELMNVQLLVTKERYNEAKWILEQVESTVTTGDDDTLYCYYYYLTTLVNRTDEQTGQVVSLVRHMYQKNPANWRIAWLLMYLDEDFARSGQKKWEFLSRLHDLGAISPVLYVEAFGILQNNPTILGNLGDFELRVLRYMAKKEIFTRDIIEQFIYVFGRSKVIKKSLIPILKECYKVYPDNEVLKALCMVLINLGETSREAFKWYEKGIENELKITKLYEYYMMSVDMDANIKIPKMALMYFAFDSSLDSIHNAFLYSYMHRNRNVLTELYENYKPAIDSFIQKELSKGNNNRFLAYLYKNALNENMIDEETAKGLSKAIFVHRVLFNRDKIKRVSVHYENVDADTTYTVLNNEKEIHIPIYGSNNQVILEDVKGNSFICEDEYEIQRLMMPDKLQGIVSPYIKDDVLFDLWACEHGQDIATISFSNVENMRRLADSDRVRKSVRKEIKSHLLRFYYDSDMMDELDTLLRDLIYEEIPEKEISETIHLMAVRGMFEKAYEWICRGGGEYIDAKVIARLCKHLLEEHDISYKDDNAMTTLIYRSFMMGKSDETLLTYLVKNFYGTCKEMKEIWKSAHEAGVDTFLIEQRIMEQMLYSNAYVSGLSSILQSYNSSVACDRLTLAVLSQLGYDYFVYDKVIDDKYINVLEQFIDAREEIPFILKLTYTKFYSESATEISDTLLRTIIPYLREILSKGMYFAYFKEYASTVTFMHRFLDKTIIEYKAPECSGATIHFMIEKNESTRNEYSREEMREMYHGIFVKQFVLFFGERMQYYIIERDRDGGEQLTESGTVSCSDMDHQESGSRYSLINDIAIARTLADYDTMDKLLAEYFQYENYLSAIFRMSE
ncbi:MAG: DUF5717 family protein [Lachnospiraceae bacterium]|nr:DUF5717 family protein [Lachnospiraceae bacterium]